MEPKTSYSEAGPNPSREKRLSFWLCVCSISRNSAGGTDRDLRLNLALETEASQLTQGDLAGIRNQAVKRAIAHYGLSEAHVQGVVIENIISLGRMTEAEFLTTGEA